MAIDYQVIESQGTIVYTNNPYAKGFFTFGRSASDFAYVTLNYYTNYTDPNDTAKVYINGAFLPNGYISPMYYGIQGNNPYGIAALTLPFPNSVLNPSPFPGLPVFNVLEIVLQGNLNDPSNWLWVQTVICTYKQA